MSFEDLTVPMGTRVVHIGFNKTGTTSVQGAVALAREQLPEHGLVYPGTARYHKMAGLAITGVPGRLGDRVAAPKDWETLVEEVTDAGENRVLVSSEWLCEATDEQARQAVEELGGGRAHVVATLRPLTSILPSSWQQYLQNGARFTLDAWLKQMLLEPPFQARDTPSFWRRHQHDVVLARWASIVGPQNVTAIIVDPSDRSAIFRQFEGLLGLPEGLLVLDPMVGENRSLTWPEAEMLRRVNQLFRKQKWPEELYRFAIREGMVARLVALSGETVTMPKVVLPQWAVDRAGEIGAGMADNISALGIRVVGDLQSIGGPPASAGGKNPPAVLPAAFVATIVAEMTEDRRASEDRLREASAAWKLKADERAATIKELLKPPPPTTLQRVGRLGRRAVRKAKREVLQLGTSRKAPESEQPLELTGQPDSGGAPVTADQAAPAATGLPLR